MRDILQDSKVDTAALKAIEGFHSQIVAEVKEAVGKNKIVVVGMSQNPVVTKARKLLKTDGFDFKYLEYGSYTSQWKPRLAIKLWSGWPTFPQVFVDGKLIGGCAELSVLLKNGDLKK